MVPYENATNTKRKKNIFVNFQNLKWDLKLEARDEGLKLTKIIAVCDIARYCGATTFLDKTKQKYLYWQNGLPYLADVKHNVNKTGLIL